MSIQRTQPTQAGTPDGPRRCQLTNLTFEMNHLLNLSLGLPTRRLDELAWRKLPVSCRDYSLGASDTDKIFAGEWLDSHHVLLGSKDQQLFVINVVTGLRLRIPAPTCVSKARWDKRRCRVAVVPTVVCNLAHDSHSYDSMSEDSFGASDSTDSASSESAQSTESVQSDDELDLRGDSGIDSNTAGSPGYYSYPILNRSASPCTGIRAICCNNDRTLMAIAVGHLQDDKYDSSVWFYALPDLQPLFRCVCMHRDAIFQLAFINDTTLATVSRDGYTVMWDIDWGQEVVTEMANQTTGNPNVKMRDMARVDNQVAVLATEPIREIHLYDASNLRMTSTVSVQDTDLTALAVSSNALIAAGGQGRVSLVDHRMPDVVRKFPSVDGGFGVRSLTFGSPAGGQAESILTIGGGAGRLSFFDVRNHGYLCWDANSMTAVSADGGHVDRHAGKYVQVGPKEAVRTTNGRGMPEINAIYGLKYNGCRLLMYGGPLHTSSVGSFASLFM